MRLLIISCPCILITAFEAEAEAASPLAAEPKRAPAAQDSQGEPASQAGQERAEFSIGAILDARYASGYASLTWAWGKPITQEGFLLRLAGEASRYAFTTSYTDESGASLPLSNIGVSASAEILVGRQWSLDRLWLKAFIGLAYGGHAAFSGAPSDGLSGAVLSGAWELEPAPTGVVEAWLRLSESAWASADASYAGGGASRATATLSLGLQPWEGWEIGPELGLSSDTESLQARAGGFVRLTRKDAELGVKLTLSGGVAFSEDGLPSPYGGLSLFRRF